ncbi:MAG: hypothetical protein MI723_19360, partial [Caulobacterales bacterium]|nr:hypothetical protein [Caulobacterales bacterium]
EAGEAGGEGGRAPRSDWIDGARLGSGLHILQFTERADDGPRYSLIAARVRRQGFVALPLPPPAARRYLAEEDGLLLSDPTRYDPYGVIEDGAPAAVRRHVRRAAQSWLAAAAEEDAFEVGGNGPLMFVRREGLPGGLGEADAIARAGELFARDLRRLAARR